jgi:hypothetical protein
MLTIDEIRHRNLLLILEHERGSVQAVATKVGKAHAQISQLKNRNRHSNSQRVRTIGDDMARELEAAYELPRGWMDNFEAAFPAPGEPVVPIEQRVVVADVLSRMPAEERRAMLRFIRYSVETSSAGFTEDDRARYSDALDAFDAIPQRPAND